MSEHLTSGASNGRGAKTPARCPICHSDTVDAYRPFCSKRCADVDLGRWLGGRYVIPETNVGDDDRTPLTPANDDEDESTARD